MSVMKWFRIIKPSPEVYAETETYKIVCQYCLYEEQIHRSYPRSKLLELDTEHGKECKQTIHRRN